MPRRPRVQDPDLIQFVTNTCIARQYLLVPGKSMNDSFRRRLRTAARIYKVEVIAAICMGNHFHLIVRCPLMNLGDFMCYFQGLLARDVIKLRGLEETVVFPTRYKAEPILDDEALLDKLDYIVTNPVRAGIVDHPREYPGYTSWTDSVGDHATLSELEGTEAGPEVVPPPMWAHLPPEEIADEWRELVEPTVRNLRRSRGRRVLGPRRALRVKYWEKPWRTREKKRDRKGRIRNPIAHASTLAAWQTYVRFVDSVATQYREAMAALRKGEFVTFPYGTRPPGWARCECDTTRQLPALFRRDTECVLSAA